jgi:tetratricopeptide (TPR) repeat protein
MPQRQLDDALAQLVSVELIYRRGTPPDAEYTFKHALVQDAAYGTLLRSRRQQLHGRIAASLESRFPEIVAAQPGLLAHQCEEAGLTEKAVDYWLSAGRQAWGRAMLAEAVALLRRGLALVPALPDGDARREIEFGLQIALGQAQIASRGLGAREAGDAYSRARQLAEALNRPRELLSGLCGQWIYHVMRGDLSQGREIAAEMRRLGDETGGVGARVLGYHLNGYACLHLGEFTVAREDLEQGLALFEPTDRPFYAEVLAYDPLVALLAHSAFFLVCLGHFDQAMSRRDAALAEPRRLSQPFSLAVALVFAWMMDREIRSEPGRLLECADECLALATEHGLGSYHGFALVERGWSLASLGRVDEGITLLNSGRRAAGQRMDDRRGAFFHAACRRLPDGWPV